MRREEFEEKLLDFIDGALNEDDMAAMRAAVSSDASLAESLEFYRSIMSAEESVAAEEYRATPKLALRVMERIEKAELSLADQFARFFRAHRQFIVGFSTAALLVIIIRGMYPSAQHEIAFQHPPTIGSPAPTAVGAPPATAPPISSPPAFVTSAPIEARPELPTKEIGETISIINLRPIPIGEPVSTGKKKPPEEGTPWTESQKGSALEDFLNSMGTEFPVGPDFPVAVSFELVRSPEYENELILRVTLTGVRFESAQEIPARDIKLDFEILSPAIKAISPYGKQDAWYRIDQPVFRWAEGPKLIADQQFTSLAVLGLVGKIFPGDVLAIRVSFTDNENDTPISRRYVITEKEIVQLFSQASPGLHSAFSMALLFETMLPNIPGLSASEIMKDIAADTKRMKKTTDYINEPLQGELNPEKMKEWKRRMAEYKNTLKRSRPRPKYDHVSPEAMKRLDEYFNKVDKLDEAWMQNQDHSFDQYLSEHGGQIPASPDSPE